MATPPLNFERAIYEGETPAPDKCVYCGRGITNEYFRVGGHMACMACAQQAQSLTPPDAHAVFAHALGYGVLAAIVGCIGYALIVITTGWTIGYAAIGVGYLVGWAMRKAAKEHGGRRYQWAAALLTYAAVAMATIPIIFHSDMKEGLITKHQVTATTNGTQTQAPAKGAEPEHLSVGGFILVAVELIGLGLGSPFAQFGGSFAGGLLNLFILFIGVRFAWQTMAVRTVSVEGPFEAVTPPSPSTP